MTFSLVVVYLLVAHVMSEVLPPVDHRNKPVAEIIDRPSSVVE